MKSLYLDSPYPQPIDGGVGPKSDGTHEFIDYLPNTYLRIWYSQFNQLYPEHWHNEIEMVYCNSGHYIMSTKESMWELHEGDIILLPGGIAHSLDMKEDCHGFVYLINLSLLEHIPSAALILPLISQPIFLKKGNNRLYHSVNTLLEQMRNEYFSDNDLREFTVYSHMLMLLTKIGRSHLSDSKKRLHLRSDKQKEYIDRFSEILKYINDNYSEDITLEQISKKFGFSKYHFSRLFSQYTTYNFCDYLTYRRLRNTELLLLDSDLSITEIAIHSGFNSPSSFNRAFKQKNLCTPSEYRKLASK